MAFALLACLGLVAYSYLGYPALLALWAGGGEVLGCIRFVVGGADRRAPGREGPWPPLTIIVPAHDEESCIAEKVANCLALDYPADRIEVLIGCDGCTDRTADLARRSGDPRVRVVELSPRAGKAAVLSRLGAMAAGDVLLMTDANVALEARAAKALAGRFRDPRVGAVVGRLRLHGPSRGDRGEGIYWQYESALKYLEGKRGCVLGANGGIYAVRRRLFQPLRETTIVDDFVIPLRIASRGWRVTYEPQAVAHEEAAPGVEQEFARRARIGAGDWQALALVPGLLDPRAGFLHFAFVSHKLLRWLAPFLLAAALSLSLALALRGSALASALLAAQLGFYALALLGGRAAAGRGALSRLASGAHYFVTMNLALALGLWRFVRGTQRATWERTERSAPPGVGTL
jgi:cellulose synthase/poly-beta-1,6-N-acetylglucosamine synthase-like glycosyltransferase